MNNKKVLVLLTLVPVLIGYIINFTLTIPLLGTFIFYLLPLCVFVFWFILGFKYSKTNWKPITCILVGNAVGIISLLMYIWQFVLTSDELRNSFFATLSQMFTSATPSYLLNSVVIALFNVPTNSIAITLQICSVVFMGIIFSIGYFVGAKQNKIKG